MNIRQLVSRIIMALLLLKAAGCAHEKSIVIDPVQPWEGHFYTAEEFHQKTECLNLSKKQSVWVLSDRTLSRVLKNLKESQAK